MRFGFRITRGLWVSLPWWCFPIILVVLLVELVVYIVALPFMLVSGRRKTARHPPALKG